MPLALNMAIGFDVILDIKIYLLCTSNSNSVCFGEPLVNVRRQTHDSSNTRINND